MIVYVEQAHLDYLLKALRHWELKILLLKMLKRLKRLLMLKTLMMKNPEKKEKEHLEDHR